MNVERRESVCLSNQLGRHQMICKLIANESGMKDSPQMVILQRRAVLACYVLPNAILELKYPKVTGI
jgi:hypothetical protein